ncbi:hypothetical protein AB0392_50530 [Nonomuraea angiospora]|uniref:hypothetical protein n=1 Tax=Nonomuraea angiospora TaxID=46172 RepID=UPI00344C1B91
MPITHHDPTSHQLEWENHDRTQSLSIAPPDIETAAWLAAHSHEWACWLNVSGTGFGLTAEHTQRLNQLVHAVGEPEQTHTIPAAPPTDDLTLTITTSPQGLDLHVTGPNADGQSDIPATDTPTIAHLLDQLTQ